DRPAVHVPDGLRQPVSERDANSGTPRRAFPIARFAFGNALPGTSPFCRERPPWRSGRTSGLLIACLLNSLLSCSRSQTRFGNARSETPFRASPCLETEF